MTEQTEWVFVPEAARRLDVASETVRWWIKIGRLEGEKVSTPRGPRWRVRVPIVPVVALEGGETIAALAAEREDWHRERQGYLDRIAEQATTIGLLRTLCFLLLRPATPPGQVQRSRGLRTRWSWKGALRFSVRRSV
jgi:hypothetical protein